MQRRLNTATLAAALICVTSSTSVLGAELYSTTGDITIGTVSLQDGDVWTFDPTSEIVDRDTLFTTQDEDIDAFHYVSDTSYYLSTSADASINKNSFTSGQFVLVDAAGTPTRNVVANTTGNIDAAYVSGSGQFYFSWTTDQTFGSVTAQQSDVWIFDPSKNELVTEVFDGASIFTDGNLEDLDAFHVRQNGNFLLSTSANAEIGTLSFASGDVIEYNPTTGGASMFLGETTINATGGDNIDAISVIPEPVTGGLVLLGSVLLLRRRLV